MTDIQAWLDQGKTLADKATEGPWEVEESSDGWSEIYGRDPIEPMVTPTVATTERGGENEAAFIADARTRLPQALDTLQAVHDMHRRIWVDGIEYCKHCVDFGGEYPCPTVQAIHDAIKETEA